MNDRGISRISRRAAMKGTLGTIALTALGRATNLAAQSVPSWPSQPTGGRVHALPGINIWGSDSYGGSGRNPVSTGVDILLVNSLASANTVTAIQGLGSNVYACTLEGALKFNAGTRSKQIILCCGGTPNYSKGVISVGDNWSVWGQFAPAPGLWPRGLRINAGGRRHWQVWHLPMYLGEDVFGPLPENQSEGDAFRAGMISSTSPAVASKWLFVNCEFSRTTDELMDAYNGMSEGGFVYCAFVEALGYWNGTVHRTQYGPIFGGARINGVPRTAEKLSIERSFFAHNTKRNPQMSVVGATLANNLYYNIGRLAAGGEDGPGVGPQITNQPGHTAAMRYNLLRSMFVRGPDSISTIPGVYAQLDSHPEFPAGSGIFIAGCVQHGWSNPAAQSAYLIDNESSIFQSFSSIRLDALPPGRLQSFNDTRWIAGNPNAPTQSEKQTFFNMIEDSIGVQPKERTSAVGRVHNALSQCNARLNGNTSTTRQLVKNSTEAGGWWTMPTITVNPANPGAHWHAPLPTSSSRHTPLTAGTFSNGISAVGYTPMEVWAIEQHYYRGGK